MISKSEKSQIKALLQQPMWSTAERVVQELIEEVRERDNLADSEWETLKNVVLHEGYVRGIREFIKKMYTYASDEI